MLDLEFCVYLDWVLESKWGIGGVSHLFSLGDFLVDRMIMSLFISQLFGI